MADEDLLALGAQYVADDAASEIEERRLRTWGDTLLDALIRARPVTAAGRTVKVRALALLNDFGGESWDRRLLWSLARDLIEDRAQAAWRLWSPGLPSGRGSSQTRDALGCEPNQAVAWFAVL